MSDITKALEQIGLTQPEASIYVNLLRNGTLTATELSQLTGVNRTQIYPVLAGLQSKGVCTVIRGTVKKYCPVNPQQVLASFEKELDSKKNIIKGIGTELSSLFTDCSANNNPIEFLHVLNSKNSIAARINDLELGVKEHKCAFNKPPYLLNNGNHSINEIPREGNIRKPEKYNIERGVHYRSIFEVETDNIEEFISKMDMYEKTGENIKVSHSLPFKMFVYDNQTVLLALRNKADSSLSFTTMVFEHTDFAESMIQIFDIYWDKALTIKELIQKKDKREKYHENTHKEDDIACN